MGTDRPHRRGRLTVAILGAPALIIAAGALVAFSAGGDDGGDIRLTAAGPAPSQIAPSTVPPNAPPTGEVPPEATTTTTVDSLTVTPVHPRTSPPQPDDPVVRPPAADPSGSTSSPVLVPPPTTVAPSTGAPLAPCPASHVKVTVVTDRSSYALGQTVQGSSTVENRSATACLLPTRAFFKILNGAGKDVGSFAYTADFRFPVQAEPGKTFTSSLTWDQKDCTGAGCVPAAPGTYQVVADWTESGPYTGTNTFQITR